MKKQFDIHKYGQRIEGRKRHLAEYFKTHNGICFLRFVDYLYAKNYSEGRIMKYFDMIPRIDKTFREVNGLKDFKWQDADKEQMIRYVAFIESKKEWSAQTKLSYRSAIKRFYKWLEGDDEEYPNKVSFILSYLKKKDDVMMSPDELITEEEMQKLINVTEHPRDRALMSLLCESGCRIGEALSLQIKNIKFDEFGCLATLEGKTGQRTIRLVFSSPDLASWIDSHPIKDKESALFVHYGNRSKGKQMSYPAVRRMMNTFYEKARIKKRKNPHLLRHSRASILAGKNVFGEFQLNQYFGWVQGGKMAGKYLHLNCKSTEDSLLSYYGVKPIEKIIDSGIKPKICPRCKKANNCNSEICKQCGGVLDTETALKLEQKNQKFNEVMGRVFKDEELLNLFMKKVEEII